MSDLRPQRWQRVTDPRPVGFVHGPADRAIALRLLGDARSLGVSGVLVAPGDTAEQCAAVRDRVRGLVLLQTGHAAWSDAQLADVQERIAAGQKVAVARMSGTRYPPVLAGLPVLLLSERRYKTDQGLDAPGYTFVADVFGVGPEQTGEARRGYVFVSYRGIDAGWVADDIVPALAEQGFGLFDYRGTEELDETQLNAEYDRWLARCGVLLVVATESWEASAQTKNELNRAREHSRPVVGLLPSARREAPELGQIDCTVTFMRADRDGPGLAAALRHAIVTHR